MALHEPKLTSRSTVECVGSCANVFGATIGSYLVIVQYEVPLISHHVKEAGYDARSDNMSCDELAFPRHTTPNFSQASSRGKSSL